MAMQTKASTCSGFRAEETGSTVTSMATTALPARCRLVDGGASAVEGWYDHARSHSHDASAGRPARWGHPAGAAAARRERGAPMKNGGIVDEELDLRGSRGLARRRLGKGVPLVLVPGCGRDHHDFDPLLDELAGHDLLVPALPGRAGVPGAPPASAEEAARYVLAVLDACGITRVVVGGHSYGGAIALELALAAPTRVAGLALLSTGARLRVAPAMLEAVAASGDDVALADWQACHRFDRLPDITRVRGPAAIVVGQDDPLTPVRYSRFLHDAIVPSTLTVIEGAGHEAPSTHADEVAAALRGLLGSLATA